MDFLTTKARRAWAVLMVLGAMSGCSDPAVPLPVEGAPDEFSFYIGGFGSGSTSLEMKDGRVIVWHIPWDYKPGMRIDSLRATPATEDWAAFWTAAETAGVGRWRREYRAEKIVDGVGWSLRLARDGTVIESGGSNAYPDCHGDEHEGFETPEFRAFLEALDSLTGWDFRWRPRTSEDAEGRERTRTTARSASSRFGSGPGRVWTYTLRFITLRIVPPR
ncbi:MAG TPA: hypothetical protein VF006_20605 [Longimicrobium sp.]